MKFKIGESVTILNTECKPAGTGIVQSYISLSKKYSVLFEYPDNAVDVIEVPEERILPCD